MYIFPEMLSIARKKFPTKAYKTVAENIALCNPNVHTADMMIAVVEAILKVPKNRIKTITYNELVDEFGMPDVGMCEYKTT